MVTLTSRQMDTVHNDILMQGISRSWYSVDWSSNVLRHELITQLFIHVFRLSQRVHTHTTARCHNSHSPSDTSLLFCNIVRSTLTKHSTALHFAFLTYPLPFGVKWTHDMSGYVAVSFQSISCIIFVIRIDIVAVSLQLISISCNVFVKNLSWSYSTI
jgi:hypothetical protein